MEKSAASASSLLCGGSWPDCLHLSTSKQKDKKEGRKTPRKKERFALGWEEIEKKDETYVRRHVSWSSTERKEKAAKQGKSLFFRESMDELTKEKKESQEPKQKKRNTRERSTETRSFSSPTFLFERASYLLASQLSGVSERRKEREKKMYRWCLCLSVVNWRKSLSEDPREKEEGRSTVVLVKRRRREEEKDG